MSAYRPNPSRIAALDELEVDIEKLIQGGDGFARADGLPILIPRAAPGDRLKVRIVERKPDYARGEIVEIFSPGPDRREPPCPYFERCGGCDLQHLEDARQLEFKVAAARETFAASGRTPAVRGRSSFRSVLGLSLACSAPGPHGRRCASCGIPRARQPRSCDD